MSNKKGISRTGKSNDSVHDMPFSRLKVHSLQVK